MSPSLIHLLSFDENENHERVNRREAAIEAALAPSESRTSDNGITTPRCCRRIERCHTERFRTPRFRSDRCYTRHELDRFAAARVDSPLMNALASQIPYCKICISPFVAPPFIR